MSDEAEQTGEQSPSSSDEEVQEFVEEVENDPSATPPDEDWERVRGG